MPGIGSILANPLVISVLAADAIKSTQEAYNAAQDRPDPNDQRFVQRALATGQPVSSIEPKRGFFGKALQGAGILPNQIQANPDQQAEEVLALRGQREANIERSGKLAALAKDIGSANFTTLMKQYGEDIALPFPTPDELRYQNMVPKGKLEYPVGGKYGSGDEEFVTEKDIMANAGKPKAGKSFQPPTKPPLSAEEMGARAAATRLSAANTIDTKMNLREYETATKSSWWDPYTMSKADPNKFKNAEDASNAGYVNVPNNGVPAIKQTRNVLAELKQLRSYIADPKKSPFLVAGNAAALNINAKKDTGLDVPYFGYKLYLGRSTTDPEYSNLSNQIFNIEIPALYQMQRRYASGVELKMSPEILPNVQNDFRAGALRKIDNFTESLQRSVMDNLGAAGSDNEKNVIDTDVSKALDDIIDRSGPSGDSLITGRDSRGDLIEPTGEIGGEEPLPPPTPEVR